MAISSIILALLCASAAAASSNVSLERRTTIDLGIGAAVLSSEQCTGNTLLAVTSVSVGFPLNTVVNVCACVSIGDLTQTTQNCPACPANSRGICQNAACGCACNAGFTQAADGSCTAISASVAVNLARRRKLRRDEHKCPVNELACPLGGSRYECVMPNSLEHCGTCGNSCENQPGVALAGCENGGCVALKCKAGFVLGGSDCIKI